MKLFFKLLLLTLFIPCMAKAVTIDLNKSYYLIQTQNTSGKAIGINSSNTPAVMYADADTSQQFTFELVNSNVYQIKNGNGLYLTWSGSGTSLAYQTSSTENSSWTIEDVGSTGFVRLKSLGGNSYLTSANSINSTNLTIGGSAPSSASLGAFKLVVTTDLLQNNVIDSGFEYGIANSAPVGKWVNDIDAAMGGSASSRIYTDPQVVATGSHAFQLRFLDDGKSYNKISYLLTNLKKDASYKFSFDFTQLKWDHFTGTFSVYGSTSPNLEYGNNTNVNGTKFSSTRATSLQVRSGEIAFIAPDTSCYIVFSKNGDIYTENYIDNLALVETQNQDLEFITPSKSNVTSETTLPGTFKVTGINLSNPITITVPSGFSVSPTTLPANAIDSEVSVSFSGSSARNGIITLTSGSASTTINVSGYLTIKPDPATSYHLVQNTSSNAIDKTETDMAILSIVDQSSPTQQFNFENAGSPNTYYIKNQSGEYIEATEANEIKYVTSTSDRSKWIIVGTRDKYVRLRNFVSNTYLRSNSSTSAELNDSGLADDGNAVFSLTTSFKIPPLTPRWALGHIVWEDNGNTQQVATKLVNDYFAHNMPVSGVIIDSPWSTAYNSFEWDTNRYPNSTQMIQDFNSKNVKTILWLTGCINRLSNDTPLEKDPSYDEAIEKGYVVNNGKESNWWKGTGVHLDFTNPDAVAWWNTRLDKVFVDGVAGFKVDQGAIYYGDYVTTSVGTITNAEFRPYYYNSMFDYVTSKKSEGMIVGRPFSHQGGFAASIEKLSLGWCGDFSGNFGGLKLQVSNIFTSAEEGYGAPGCEIGGFFQESSNKNELIRYVQFGSMTASMINGGENGGLTNHLPWWHDTETENSYRQAVWLHNQLVPYIFSNIVKSHVSSGGSIIKNFNRAQESHTLGDLIFTKAITSTNNNVTYTLPNFGKWMDFWNRTTYPGGTVIDETYDFSKFPLFLKVGSIIPMDITNSYSGIGSAELDTYQTMVIVPDADNATSIDYFRPLGDGVDYDTVKISYNGPSSQISVDGSNSVKYAFLLLDVNEPLNVVNSDSYEYDAAKRELLIKKTGTDFTMTVEFSTVSIKKNDNLDYINIFPNPVNDIVNIQTGAFTDFNVKIYNVTGELILNENKKGHTVLNLSKIKSGVYFLRVEQDNKIIAVKKIIKN